MVNRTNIRKPPQFAEEGTTPTTYGLASTIATGATWIAPLQRGKFEQRPGPEFQENLFKGRLDRQGKFKIWETNQITISGRLTQDKASLDLFTWASDTTDSGRQGPNKSRTWLFSYMSADDTAKEIYVVARGCKPEACSLNINKADGATIELTMSCEVIFEGNMAAASDWQAMKFGGVPTGLKDNENESVPLLFRLLGDFHFDPKIKFAGDHAISVTTTVIPWRTFNSQIQWELRRQDSNGAERDLFVDYGGRSISGSVGLFKKNADFQNMSKTDDLYAAYLNLEKTTTTKVNKHAQVALQGSAGSDNQLVVIAKLPGSAGDDIKIWWTIGGSGVSKTTVSSVSGKNIVLQIKNGGDTLANVAAAINGDKFASRLVHAGADGSGNVTVAVGSGSAKTTAGGAAGDKARKLIWERWHWQPSSEPLLDDTTATIEDKPFMSDVQTTSIPA